MRLLISTCVLLCVYAQCVCGHVVDPVSAYRDGQLPLCDSVEVSQQRQPTSSQIVALLEPADVTAMAAWSSGKLEHPSGGILFVYEDRSGSSSHDVRFSYLYLKKTDEGYCESEVVNGYTSFNLLFLEKYKRRN
ncbi:hypothetical protein HY970_02990 [Candidatus Kaiserbacteria bacterium]|nr:hypothetical protein [Candidatus Kaiserbacteria bacterium]